MLERGRDPRFKSKASKHQTGNESAKETLVVKGRHETDGEENDDRHVAALKGRGTKRQTLYMRVAGTVRKSDTDRNRVKRPERETESDSLLQKSSRL